MTEPTTPLKALIIPNTGDLVGSWGTAAVNVDWTAVDGMLGGVQTISLAAATTFTLSAPAGSITPGAGPNQAQNAVLKFTGTLTGNAVITLPLPGRYIVKNSCTVGTNYIQMRAVGTGNLIGIPDGRAIEVWSDGTDVDFCDQADPGAFLDLAMATTPSWYAGCTVLPWLICDSSVYTTSIYPILGGRLGSTFGGNGITTFGVPDLRARNRISLDNQGTQGAAGRVTVALSGVNGTTIGSSGGAQNQTLLKAQLPATALSISGALTGGDPFFRVGGPTQFSAGSGNLCNTLTGSVTGTTALLGSGNAFTTMPPVLVAGLTLIKT